MESDANFWRVVEEEGILSQPAATFWDWMVVRGKDPINLTHQQIRVAFVEYEYRFAQWLERLGSDPDDEPDWMAFIDHERARES